MLMSATAHWSSRLVEALKLSVNEGGGQFGLGGGDAEGAGDGMAVWHISCRSDEAAGESGALLFASPPTGQGRGTTSPKPWMMPAHSSMVHNVTAIPRN